MCKAGGHSSILALSKAICVEYRDHALLHHCLVLCRFASTVIMFQMNTFQLQYFNI